MKQHYIRTAIIIDGLILAIFLLGMGIYTYILAKDEMNTDITLSKAIVYSNVPTSDSITSEDEFIRYSFANCWNTYGEYGYEGMGFYGYLETGSGAKFDTSTDYCTVVLAEDHYFSSSEYRIFYVDDTSVYDDKNLYDPSFTGEVDDVFIHGGEMLYQNKTYKVHDVDYQGGELIPASEWKNDTYLYGTVMRFAKTNYDAKLNKEAKAKFDELYAQIKTGEDAQLQQISIWTTYQFKSTVTRYGVYVTMHVFHPVQIVMMANKGTYIALTIALIIIEAIIAFAMSKLYKNNMEFEMKSRRLTRGVAHELKTPLAVTKAYMENWDYIDEKDREEYAKKINREVDDMTVLINALLEMDKINSGNLKLNIEEIDISALLWSVYNHVRPLAMERNLNVKMPDAEEIMIKADLKFMKIALGNYLTNMVKYADKKAEVQIVNEEKTVWIKFRNDSSNDKKNNTDKLNSNGMGVEINENIMKLHGFKYGSSMGNTETVFWFEAEKA